MARDAVFMARAGIIGVCELPLRELFPEAMEEPEQVAMSDRDPKDSFIPIEEVFDEMVPNPLEALCITQGVIHINNLPDHVRRQVEDIEPEKNINEELLALACKTHWDKNGICAITCKVHGVIPETEFIALTYPQANINMARVMKKGLKSPLSRHEIYRRLIQLGEGRSRSHGRYGRQPFSTFIRETLRKIASQTL